MSRGGGSRRENRTLYKGAPGLDMQTLRLATAADHDAIVALVNAAYRKYIERMGKKPGPMLMDYHQILERDTVYVLELDGQVSGLLVLQLQPDYLWLDNIALAPHAQGQGHGKQLMRFTEQFAREHGLNEIRLLTSEKMTENIERYTRWGFVETERRDEHGYRRVYMRKML